MNDKILKSDSMITYNHMQGENLKSKTGNDAFSGMKNKAMIKFIAEELLIALLLALIFYMI